MSTEIKRGEIYWVDWSPGRGSEQSGLRPALIIQNDIGNKHSPTTIVAACSTAEVKDYPFIVRATKDESESTRDFHVNLSAILTIDKSYLRDKCGRLNDDKMAEIDEAIKHSLAIA
jgi:mRNA interferase MazF